MLTDAARRATELGDLALTERAARAAVAAGGGFAPRLLLGNALHWAGADRGAEAETELAAVAALARTAAQLATWSAVIAGGGLGRLKGLTERVRWIDGRAEAFEIGLHQAAVIGSSWVRAMLLAGLLDEPDQASRRYREQCQDTPGIGDVITGAMRGAVAACRGQVRLRRGGFASPCPAARTPACPAFTLLVDLPGVVGMAGTARWPAAPLKSWMLLAITVSVTWNRSCC